MRHASPFWMNLKITTMGYYPLVVEYVSNENYFIMSSRKRATANVLEVASSFR